MRCELGMNRPRMSLAARTTTVAIVAVLFLTLLPGAAVRALAREGQAASVRRTEIGTSDVQVGELLRRSIEALQVYDRFLLRKERIHTRAQLAAFYERRGFAPAWSRAGQLLPQADSLLEAVRTAAVDGLDPGDYHLAGLDELRQEWSQTVDGQGDQKSALLRDLDLLLSDAWLLMGAHILAGRVHPETFDPLWRATVREADLATLLDKALAAGAIRSTLHALVPDHGGYTRLRAALGTYRELAAKGGWPSITGGSLLRPGARGPRVATLRRRLCCTGDLDTDCAADSFDAVLELAIRRFQARHGLATDALVGPATLAALNVSAAQRCRQIELNLERWRWLPESLGQDHILVNIASFTLAVRRGQREVLTMPVVVGRQARRTPVFSDRLTYLVLCPSWTIPPTIVKEDILPAVQRDPAYLRGSNIRVFEGWGSSQREVDPHQINWSALSGESFPYRLRQDPGPDNALGSIKFMFPNKFDVYLHDTPARELFGRAERTFSSGCIRIADPLALAVYLLRDDPHWTREALRDALSTWRERTVRLPQPIPIHIEYWTAWVEADGTVQFRRDVYERDTALMQALSTRHDSG